MKYRLKTHLAFYIIAISTSLFCMKPSCQNRLWIKTTDNRMFEVSLVFAEQSNLLKTLHTEKTEKNDTSPVEIPVDAQSFDLLYRSIPQPVESLLKKMPQTYSLLITAAEKLKCPIFYAQLIEQLIPNDVIQKIESFLDWKKLDKRIIQYSLNKQRILKSTVNKNAPFIRTSIDGTYFLENISTKEKISQINLWTTNPVKKIKTFDSHPQAYFNPMGEVLLLSYGMDDCLYFIKKNEKHSLSPYMPSELAKMEAFLFHPTHNICCIRYYHSGQETYLLFRYIPHEAKIELIECSFGTLEIEKFNFLPDEEKIVYKNKKKALIVANINDNIDQDIIAQNVSTNYVLYCPNNKRFIISAGDMHKESLITTYSGSSIIDTTSHTIERVQDTPNWHIPLKMSFNEIKSLYAYSASSAQINICNTNGKTIALYQGKYYIETINFHPNGNHLIVVNSKNGPPSYPDILTIWDVSNSSSAIKGKIIHANAYIKNTSFMDNDFFLSHGNKTIIWDVQGNRICTVSKNESAYALTPSCFITATHIDDPQNMNDCLNPHIRTTKLYLTSNMKKVVHSYIAMRNKLSLSEKLLFKMFYNQKYKECSPNMPDGRALISLRLKKKKEEDSNVRRILQLLIKNLHLQPQ